MNNVKDFVRYWRKRGYEKGETQKFWLQFLRDVLEIPNPEEFIEFEVPVKLKHISFIDAFFPDTKVIIEQKSFDKNLTKEKAYEQAQKYITGLPRSMHPYRIITCNFAEFRIYDMETLAEPTKILLEELPEKFHTFDFLIDPNKKRFQLELQISLEAGKIVDEFHKALKEKYINPESEESLQSLNKLCVRLVFCFYAESADIFGKHKIFCDYLQKTKPEDMRQKLISLFEVLNTPENLRDPYLADDLKIFPYVNGGLFEGNIEIPQFDFNIKKILVYKAGQFNWAGISPTIFGGLFEYTLNPKIRRKGGMHYTSPKNIHKVIDPLFFDDLRAEFKAVKKISANKKQSLLNFQNKLAKLKFFDPACGSGNFLTETFLSLRRLENDVLKELLGSQIQMGNFIDNPVKVSINQFFGVEINDFAVAVAKTALWISELQMIQETQEIIHRNLDFLPLKSYPNIFEDNALTLDWKNILPADLNYIISNPPFVGTKEQTAKQKADIISLCKDLKPLDYVTGWFKKASDFIYGKNIRCAFVATNSITQGEQVAPLWKNLNVHIDFAYKTFKWLSESEHMAQVHVVIIGFSNVENNAAKKIFSVTFEKNPEGKTVEKISATPAQNINGYLIDAPNIFIEKRKSPLCNVPAMNMGSQPNDDGNLIIEAEDYENFIKKEPLAKKYIRPLLGSEEFINGKKRYCLWLVDCPPNELRKMKTVYEKVKAVKAYRLKSKRENTRKGADFPFEFLEDRQPETDYILVPKVSSENRRYVPIGFLDKNIVVTDSALTIPRAGLYEFGILTSSVHMAWMKTVCGRLKSDFRYSATIVYNNFVWCAAGENQRLKIESTAQKILAARAKYPDATLADLYDETTMPLELRRAHKENDLAVMEAYGFRADLTEPEIVAELMKMYRQLTK